MPVFGFTVFSGAFLLFQVQPMLGKYVVPRFGGAPAVWATCLLVFQTLLLAGYAYAYLSAKRLPPRSQVVLHLLFLVAAVIRPIVPHPSWKPLTGLDPTSQISFLLISSLGLPFVVLAGSGPLLQNWFCLFRHRPFPFRLYALSNAGSLLALLSYLAVFETNLGRSAQVSCWRVGLGVLVISTAWVGLKVWRTSAVSSSTAPTPGKSAATSQTKPAHEPFPLCLFWILLPACATLLLAAITNKICQDLPPLALLWILPVTVYLLSFVFCFAGARLYQRRWFAPALAGSLILMGLVSSGRLTISPLVQIAILISGLFVCCVVCHHNRLIV